MEGRLLSLVEAKLGEIDQKIEELTLFRANLRHYHHDLSGRLKPGSREEAASTPASCQCIGEEVDNFGK